MALPSRPTYNPLLLTYENESMYLHTDPQGCALFMKESTEPFYRIQEPLLLAEGIMTDSKTAHLVLLKNNGELCYTLISEFSNPQTTLIAKLDVRATKYRRLFLFPQGKMIHIFYAYSHQAIRDLWRIEHRYWNGSTWNSVHMGEVVHPHEPLYHVNLDRQGNLHILTMTFQGRHSLLYSNRFNGTFHIWGSPTETLKISGEIVDMTALMTSDNVHHLFWAIKNSSGQYEVRWAQRTEALELTSTWHPSPAPIKTLAPPWKSLGSMEINGVLWLLTHTREENLLVNDGTGWKTVSSNTSFHRPLRWVHKSKRSLHQTYWLEDQAIRRAPVYHHELGLVLSKKEPPSPEQYQPSPPPISLAVPPPVPAFYPEVISSAPNSYPPQTINMQAAVTSATDHSPEVIKEPDTPEIFEEPNTPELSEESVTLELSEEPLTPELSEEPLTPELSEEPLTPELSEEPVTPELSEEPVTPELSEEPVILELSEEPVTPKIFEEPYTPADLKIHTEEPSPPPVKENLELERLIKTVSNLEQENSNLNHVLQAMLSKFDQILGAITENILQPKQETNSVETAQETQNSFEIPKEELEPFKESMSNLEKETQTMSQVLQAMIIKQEENDSSLENLELQLCQIQEEKKNERSKGGFWNRWIT